MDLDRELELVEEAKTDLEAFQEIYDHYFSQIYAFCLNRVLNEEVAKDITSQVFYEAVKGVKFFNTIKRVRFASWLYKVTNNKIVDHYRRNKKEIIVEIQELEIEEERSPDQEIKEEYLQRQIAFVLDSINPRYQKILSLKFYSDLSNPEISEILNVKISQVAVLLHRSLKAFRKNFKRQYPDSEIFNLF